MYIEIISLLYYKKNRNEIIDKKIQATLKKSNRMLTRETNDIFRIFLSRAVSVPLAIAISFCVLLFISHVRTYVYYSLFTLTYCIELDLPLASLHYICNPHSFFFLSGWSVQINHKWTNFAPSCSFHEWPDVQFPMRLFCHSWKMCLHKGFFRISNQNITHSEGITLCCEFS